ncbi:MAG: NUDIX hydrolase [Pseudolabrys sp.]|nr:NUDIX hydrolase [Pseudolabrys sp.]
MGEYPKIKSRRTIEVSPWMTVIEREVEFTAGAKTELYHAVGQQDYIAIVALTPDGRIPIVKQYRPALERQTWELPAGLVDAGEEPARTCERELMEETGHSSKAVHALGVFSPCTARLSNRVHSFFVEAGPRPDDQAIEAGIELNLVSPAELGAMIYSGEFTLQLHIGALMLAGMRGFLDLTAFQAA